MILPNSVPFKIWAESLLIDFPKDDIPRLHNEDDWKSWGNYLIQCKSFAGNGAPGTQQFSDKKLWAEAVFQVMASY